MIPFHFKLTENYLLYDNDNNYVRISAKEMSKEEQIRLLQLGLMELSFYIKEIKEKYNG